MRNSVTHLASVLLLALFIGSFSVALSQDPNGGSVYRRSPKLIAGESIRDNLDGYIPARWRLAPSELRPPEIEVHLLKGRVPQDETWAFSNEYKYSNNKEPDSMESMDRTNYGNELEVPQVVEESDQTNMSNDQLTKAAKGAVQIGSRTIIVGPSYCPPGQRKDPNGVCRDVIDP